MKKLLLSPVIFCLFTLFANAEPAIKDDLPVVSVVIEKTRSYTVAEGDNLKEIASKFNTTPDELLKLNKLRNSGALKPGTKLKITKNIIVPKTVYEGLIINLPEFRIYHFEQGKLKETYDIAIGKSSWETPVGKFQVANKKIDPAWNVPPGMSSKLNIEERIVPPGPDNPLGKYWIGLSIPHIGIHSTNQPHTIGKAKSHGCMRMQTDEAEKLFGLLEVGMEGEIIYEPVKIAKNRGRIYLEVHDDIYDKFTNLHTQTVKLLNELEFGSNVDMADVERTVESRSGAPVKIGSIYSNAYSQELNDGHKKKSENLTVKAGIELSKEEY